MHNVFHFLGGLRWIDRHDNERNFRAYIEREWSEGNLPVQVGKQWIVGYDVRVNYVNRSATPIVVGPKKPSRYRDSYARIKTSERPFSF